MIDGIEIRTLRDGEFAAFAAVDGQAFGIEYSGEDLAFIPTVLELDRVVVAVDDGEIVGGGAAYPFELTLPGGAQVPVAGITWVCMQATHRRRGLLRAVMAALHGHAVERGEAACVLSASEGPIYGRFGYGVATRFQRVTIDRRAAAFQPDTPRGGQCRFVRDDEGRVVMAAVYDELRRTGPGELSLHDGWWRFLVGPESTKRSGGIPARHVVHHGDDGSADGFASYRFRPHLGDVGSEATVEVVRLVALNPVAHAELWRFVLGVDLATTVTSSTMAFDDPLPLMLVDPRAVRTYVVRDDMWLRPVDVGRLLSVRTYGGTGTLALDVGEAGTWVLRVDDDGRAACEPAGGQPGAPVLRMGRAELGALLLGDVAPSVLAAAGRIAALHEGALALADRLFVTPVRPRTMHRF